MAQALAAISQTPEKRTFEWADHNAFCGTIARGNAGGFRELGSYGAKAYRRSHARHRGQIPGLCHGYQVRPHSWNDRLLCDLVREGNNRRHGVLEPESSDGRGSL